MSVSNSVTDIKL